ncbi:MAG: phoD [Acidimicrobiia bacterium]|nr:phoD [Acidimicrobiia bacterium]
MIRPLSPPSPRPAPAGSADATSAVPSTAVPSTLPTPPLPPGLFGLGVASGDPLPDRVMLWTRLRPLANPTTDVVPAVDIPVRWEVASDDKFSAVVSSGVAVAAAADGHAVHVDATNLRPDTRYWYRFHAGDQSSAVARTRTTPADDAAPTKLRFGFASCQDFQSGFYGPWRDAAASDLDLVVFLGDYIYEGAGAKLGGAVVRSHRGGECTTLEQYRDRYAQYRSDSDLQAAHAMCPWLIIWDDHEVENNYANAQSEDPKVPTAEFLIRRAAAYRAWWEHMPVRLPHPDGPDLKIYRTQRYGKLASFFLLDGRQYRTDQACGDRSFDTSPACAEVNSPGRTMLGSEQEQWLGQQLSGSTATWDVLANQTVLSNVMLGQAVLNYDQWDGYPEARRRLVSQLSAGGKTNRVVITGDIHLGAVGMVTSVSGATRTPVATELVGTSISSGGLLPVASEGLVASFPDVRYANLRNRGWTRCEVTPQSWTAEYRVTDNQQSADAPLRTDATFVIQPDRVGVEKKA